MISGPRPTYSHDGMATLVEVAVDRDFEWMRADFTIDINPSVALSVNLEWRVCADMEPWRRYWTPPGVFLASGQEARDSHRCNAGPRPRLVALRNQARRRLRRITERTLPQRFLRGRCGA
jgi:hypothetical protein